MATRKSAARSTPRRRRGFEAVGSFAPARLGLPATKARELALASAWQRVAGDALARHTTVELRRGLLEIHVEERAWLDAVAGLVEDLSARVARDAPQLGIKRYRLQLTGDPPAEPRSVVAAAPEERVPPRRARPRKTVTPDDEPTVAPEERLARLAERYVAASARREERRRLKKPRD